MTVAVFEMGATSAHHIAERDIEILISKDSGPGGQHRNKTESCVVMRHRPTGIEAKAAAKSQHRNRATAREMLVARVTAHYAEITRAAETSARRSMVGSGMRGDKVRTYRERDDLATDHRSGRRARLTDLRLGRLELLE